MSADKQRAIVAALAIAIAAPAEGIRHYVYYDPPGIPTVCMGHTGPDAIKGKFYTDAECAALLTSDMRRAVDTVERCAPGLPPNVAASFADAVFNGGPKIVCDQQHSTAARLLAAGQLEAACRQHPRWNKATVAGVQVALPGLTRRTLQRQALCLSHEVTT
jgi:lysozyme